MESAMPCSFPSTRSRARLATQVPAATLLASTAFTAPALAQDAATADLPVISISAGQNGSLTVRSFEQARQEIQLTPGGAEVVSAAQWRDTPATTIKDMLDYVPGVFAQPK
ncbi:MAG: hypothetical protein B7Z45_08310, partial [Azorhizobium sp. 12-66-6]